MSTSKSKESIFTNSKMSLTSEPATEPTQPSQEEIDETKNNIMQKVTPLIQELDMQVVGVRLSQLELYKEIERLSAELQLCVDLPDIPNVSEGIQRLQTLRKRLQTINKTLRTVQDRLHRVASVNNI